MFRLLCLLSVLGLSLGDTVVLNQLVDQLLGGLSAELVKAGKDTLPVSNIDQEFPKRWHFIKVTGHLNCKEGYARSLASIHRTGDVSLSTNGNTFTLRVALGLGTLEFGYKSCQAEAEHIFSITQPVDATVSSNSIEAQVTVVKNGAQCTATVDRIALANLGDVEVRTGASVLHQLEDKLINWLVDKFHGEIVGMVNDALESSAKENIGKADFCSKLPAV